MRPGNGVSPHMRDQFYLDRAQSAFVEQTRNEMPYRDKIIELRDMFQDAYTGWLEIYNEAA